MPEDLHDVAARIRDRNKSVQSIEAVKERGPNNTVVDFEAGPFGLDWGHTSNFGGWEPYAVEHKGDDTYRIWFRAT